MAPAIKDHVVTVSRVRSYFPAMASAFAFQRGNARKAAARLSNLTLRSQTVVCSHTAFSKFCAVAKEQRDLAGVPLLSHKARSLIRPQDAGWNSTCGNTWSSGNNSAVEARGCASTVAGLQHNHFALRRSER